MMGGLTEDSIAGFLMQWLVYALRTSGKTGIANQVTLPYLTSPHLRGLSEVFMLSLEM